MKKLILTLALVLSSTSGNAETIERQYDGFKLWIDCDLRGHTMYQYTLGRDTGQIERKSNFKLAPDVPARCQQTSTETYKKDGKSRFDRGHGVPFNHMEHSERATRQSDFMVNVWPQHRDLNRGAMYETEKIAECYRDMEQIEVYGGIIKGATPANSDYLESHGIHTPGYFWKALIRKDRALAWILPNTPGVTKKKLDNYIVSLDDLEKITGVKFNATDAMKQQKPKRSWIIPQGCGWS